MGRPLAKLTDQERRIIACIQAKPEAPLTEISRSTRCRLHTVRYCHGRFLDEGLIRTVPFIDFGLLGFTEYAIFFTLTSLKNSARERLLRYLIDSPYVAIVDELGGEYQYMFSMYCKQIGEVVQFLDELSRSFGSIFNEKCISIRVMLREYGAKYLGVRQFKPRVLSWAGSGGSAAIDDTDYGILKELTLNPAGARRDVAQSVGVALSTVDYRVRRLSEQGVIKGFSCRVAARALGLYVFRLLVSIKGLTSALRRALSAYCQEHMNVRILIECIGSWDYELIVEVQTPEEISTLSRGLYENFGDYIGKVSILPSLQILKAQTYPVPPRK